MFLKLGSEQRLGTKHRDTHSMHHGLGVGLLKASQPIKFRKAKNLQHSRRDTSSNTETLVSAKTG